MSCTSAPDQQTHASRYARPSFGQVGLRTLLLATACTASWTMHIYNNKQLQMLEPRLTAMRPLAGVLSIKDPGRIVILKTEGHSSDDETRWLIHVPRNEIRLYLKTRNIPDIRNGIPPPTSDVKSAELTPGDHSLSLTVSAGDPSGWVISVILDSQPFLKAQEFQDWKREKGTVLMAGSSGKQVELPVGKPIPLLWQHFRDPKSARGAAKVLNTECGLCLWIE